MRSTKQSKFKSCVLSIAICSVFILCAMLSIGLTLFNKDVFAADGDETTPVAKTVDGIRFVQVAAGEDFAIGLTFDGDLYGWSLNRDSAGGATGNGIDVTLGDYYTSTPTKINVKFRQGPGGGGAYPWSGNESNEYHTEIKDDKIKKIVATRTTAAFITENGYIYTWGKDVYSHDGSIDTAEKVFMSDFNDAEHYLLYRATSGDVTRDITWYEPYIIDYGYYNQGEAKESMYYSMPTQNSPLSATDIAAGEYNYIFLYTKNSTAYTYVWGSLLYATVQTHTHESYDFMPQGSNAAPNLIGGYQERWIVGVGMNDSVVSNVVAGGYNVGLNRSAASSGVTSLQLRGRNFLTSQYNNGYVNTVSISTPTGSTASIKYTQDGDRVAAIAIAGGRGTTKDTDQFINVDSLDNYYGRLSLSTSSGSLNFAANTTVSISNSRGQTLDKVDENNLYRSVIRYGVSLGNDVGYGIAAGNLYGWGDNAHGQLGKAAGGSSQTPASILSTESSSFVAVAAGKQLSADKKAFYDLSTLDISVSGETSAVNGFNNDVKNEADFISGAVTLDGKLYVWSNNAPTPKLVTYGDVTGTVNDSDKFIAVYSGYGNNLFALTATGKLIRVIYANGGYVQYRYDTFADVGGKSIANWSVDSTNTVRFAPTVEPTPTQPDPDLGSATFYVWNSTAERYLPDVESSATLGTVQYNVSGGTAGEYIPLVSSNAIGDVYRILGIGNDDNKAGNFLSPLGDGLADITSFAPVFSYGPDAQHLTKMTAKQRENMFDFDYVTDANGVGIKIAPKQSSKGYMITVDFYVARYNAESNFVIVSGGAVKDTALYYDFKPCRITFTVADTPTVKNYSAYDENNGNKSNIPLLDPNNEYNKNYSIAVQNVSGGVDALLEYLNATSVKSNVLGAMAQVDAGFPASSKIAAGDLTYYLGADAAAKYNDVYQYLFVDRDSDRVIAGALEDGMMEGIDSPTSSVNGRMRTIAVADIDTGVVLSDGTTIDKVRAALASDFDNVYGIYGITLGVNAEKHIILGFSYDVMTFTAVASTGNVRYASNDITSYQTTASNPRVNASLQVVTRPTGFNIGFETIGSGIAVNGTRNIAAVFATATLRMNKTHSDGSTITGKSAGGKNVYTEVYAHPIVVGESVSINISDYFASRSDRIVFSYKNQATNESYGLFNNLFVDETGNGIRPVVLQGTTLTVTPSTEVPINLTVTVQRFASTDDYTEYFDGGNERIEMTFIFDQIRDFTFAASANSESTFLITKTQTIDVLARNNALNTSRFVAISGNGIDSQIENLYNRVRISDILSSEDRKAQRDKLFSVAAVAGTQTAFAITPLRSGSGVVTFTATLYNKSLTFTISINVSAVTYVTDSITVDNDKYIYVDVVKSELEKANKFNSDIDDYRILYNDISNPEAASKLEYRYNAIYFTDESGATASPSFIKNVVFEGVESSKPNIRIVSGDSVTNDAARYYMHVMFVLGDVEKYADAPDGSIIEAIYTVESGKVRIPITVNIDCRDNQNSSADGLSLTITGSGMNTSVSVSVEQLLNRVGIEGASQYSVVIIQPDSEVADYFDYASDSNGKNIILSPKSNTPTTESGQVPMVVQVSVSNGSEYKMITFDVTVSGILTTLPVMQENGIIGYGNIWLYSFIIVFGVLAIIFIVRLIVYWKKRAKQRAIIKRNQELIRMRDRMHNKATAATREQVVRTKLKMDDPKYAKMFNEMRKSKEEESGVILEHSDLAATGDAKSKKKKKKKGGKKTVAELKAELEAKKAAFAAAQAQNAQPVNPFVQDVPIDDGAYAAPDADFVSPDGGFGAPDGGFDAASDDFGAQSVDGGEIIFDASDIGDGM